MFHLPFETGAISSVFRHYRRFESKRRRAYEVLLFVDCSDKEIRIPFRVGEDKSRTWILSLDDRGLLFRHDHRHADGTPEKSPCTADGRLPRAQRTANDFQQIQIRES